MDESKIYSEAEIRQQVEALKELRSTVFFYLANGQAIGVLSDVVLR